MVQKLRSLLKTAPWYSLASGVAAGLVAWLLAPVNSYRFLFLVLLAAIAAFGWRLRFRLLLLLIALGVVVAAGDLFAAILFGIAVFLLAVSARERFVSWEVGELVVAITALLYSRAWYVSFLSPASPEGAAWSHAFLYSALLPIVVIASDLLLPKDAVHQRPEIVLPFVLLWQVMVAVWFLPASIYAKSFLFTGFAVCERGYRLNGNQRVVGYFYASAILLIIAGWAVMRTSASVF